MGRSTDVPRTFKTWRMSEKLDHASNKTKYNSAGMTLGKGPNWKVKDELKLKYLRRFGNGYFKIQFLFKVKKVSFRFTYFYFLSVYVCLPAHMYMHVCGPEEDVRSFGIRVTQGCEPSIMWVLETKPVFETAKPSLLPLKYNFMTRCGVSCL